LHLFENVFYPPSLTATWPLPTGRQFVEQYSTFLPPLKLTFTPLNIKIDKMLNDFKAKNITIPPDFTMFIVENSFYPSAGLSPAELQYYLIQGPNLMSQFEPNLNKPIMTKNGLTMVITKYGTDYYINGVSRVVFPDGSLKDGIFHVIEKKVDFPASPTDPCIPCYKNITIEQDIMNRYPLFYGFWSASGLPKTNVTVFPSPNAFFQGTGQQLYNYLSDNDTARDEYLKKFIVLGIYYPVAASHITTVVALDGTVISISPINDNTLEVNYGVGSVPEIPGPAGPRKDGISYELTGGSINFPIPPSPALPPEPEPEPIPAPFKPPTGSAGLITFNLLFLLGSLLFVVIF